MITWQHYAILLYGLKWLSSSRNLESHDITSKIGSIWKTGGDLSVLRDDVDDPFLDEVHLDSHAALPDYVIPRLEHLVSQVRDHIGDEVRIGVCEEGNGGHQGSTVVVDDLLAYTSKQQDE